MYKFKSGARYEGEWLNNKKHGQGTFYYPDGSKYEGMTSCLMIWGRGARVLWLSIFVWQTDFQAHSLASGGWIDNIRAGHGKYTYVNGDVYEGEFVGGVKEGKGRYTHIITGLTVC